MTQEEFDCMEVRPTRRGWYFVTLYQFDKVDPKHPDYIRDWLFFEGDKWDYGDYTGFCYVCFIHKKQLPGQSGQKGE